MEYMNSLAVISNRVALLNYKFLTIGGDFNMDLNFSHPLKTYVSEFCEELAVIFADLFMKVTCDTRFTYFNESHKAFSFIDHFLISKTLTINNNAILNSPSHAVKHMDFDRTDNVTGLRWDKANLNDYCEVSRILISKVYVPFNLFGSTLYSSNVDSGTMCSCY